VTALAPDPEPRPTCDRCRRPTSVCYCAALPRLETTTRVVILQHPRERDMPIGTGRMASLCLPGATLLVGVAWDDHAVLRAALSDPARPPILLYPAPGARDILADPPAGPVTLIVVDGTWWQAKTLIRDNPVLRALPRYAFVAPELSEYRIRKEPDDDYVSTIEALSEVLGVLEGDRERFRAMRAPLREMVDRHLAERGRSSKPRYRVRVKRLASEKLPAAVTTRFADLVCVVGEANAWPYAAADPGLGEELVHWVAHRPATGETFDVIAAPERPLSPTTPFHIELAADRLLAGVPRAELFARFAAFLRPTDVLCTWGGYGPHLFVKSGGTLPGERLDLRVVAQRLLQTKVGSLERYAAEVTPTTLHPVASGRAGRRATLLAQIVTAWRALP
jgi:DTW domain-containing protein YfiP